MNHIYIPAHCCCSLIPDDFKFASVSHDHAGTYCGKFQKRPPQWMQDNFEEGTIDSGQWERVEGATIGQGCGSQHGGNTLLFSGPGHRSATTRELDTRAIR